MNSININTFKKVGMLSALIGASFLLASCQNQEEAVRIFDVCSKSGTGYIVTTNYNGEYVCTPRETVSSLELSISKCQNDNSSEARKVCYDTIKDIFNKQVEFGSKTVIDVSGATSQNANEVFSGALDNVKNK